MFSTERDHSAREWKRINDHLNVLQISKMIGSNFHTFFSFVSGLSLGGGLIIFASVLSDAYMDRPRRPLSAAGSSQPLFDYRYGWSFFAAGAAFIMAEFAALVRKI